MSHLLHLLLWLTEHWAKEAGDEWHLLVKLLQNTTRQGFVKATDEQSRLLWKFCQDIKWLYLFWYSIVEIYIEIYYLFHKSLNGINIPFRRQEYAMETGGFQTGGCQFSEVTACMIFSQNWVHL